ncbi:Bug family tripartite tricarboxylate transporter substrate binding protein [Falsiroseomonas sp. HW251]|uniref:Bug family tripartite tricarboxylate transporter substrate binding protein n=1 Tax=Falsiroseomonas sp. HW251 TaxID=3390998 RepID=UPI003D30FB69
MIRLARRALCLSLAAPTLARAQVWTPSRPVVIVVPYAAGGSADALARPLADRMAARFGSPVVIENRPGAAGAIGAENVARATPDGQRLYFSSGGTMTVGPLTTRNLPYRAEDFAPVALLGTLPYAVAARQGMPETIQDLVALVRARPGRISMGGSGGASIELVVAMLAARLDLDWIAVSYRGDSAAVSDLLSGALDAAVLGGPPALAAHRSGRARLLAWTGAARVPGLPDQPVLTETWPGLVAEGWFGLHAPARTPPEAVARLNAAATGALREDPGLVERLAGEGLVIARPLSPEAFGRFVAEDAQRLAAILARLGRLADK